MKIAVGGMIASGKSTLVKQLAEKYNIPLMNEFEQDDDVFNTLLQWLYEGKENVEMLLQIYFLHKHWLAQMEFNDNVIVDRHIIEHWLFAQINLSSKPKVLNMYNGLFHQYMNDVSHPDLYIILDVDWKSFEDRIMKRGRQQEIDNFENNKEYFEALIKNYVKKLVAQCDIYEIPYVVINTNNLTEEKVLEISSKHVDKLKEKLYTL